jgi:ribosomal protein L11 methyltransferase
MVYYEVTLESSAPFAYDILTAGLSEIGFESFENEGDLLKAYIPENAYNADLLTETCAYYQNLFDFNYSVAAIPSQNWNAVWESNFQPITVDQRLRVRAVFHESDPSFPLELVIQPKMSFGTGHHATTWLVMQAVLDIDFHNKRVFDFGTGTGILAILANKIGATDVWAVDNDPQCTENASENLELNGCKGIHLATGDINNFEGNIYDIVIGNITRNVIIAFLDDISSKLQSKGLFIASGFYEEDVPLLAEHAEKAGLALIKTNTKDKWCMAIFQKMI